MSDSDDFEEDSVEDFSASEDEWKPSKRDASTSDEDDAFEEDDEDESSSRGTKRKRPGKAGGRSNAEKAFIEGKAVQESKSPPGPPRIIPGTIQEILERSRYEKSKKAADSDDSGSSGDEHLVPASELDLGSDFFSTKGQKAATPPPNFDCNIGTRLSDSEEDDEEPKDTKIMSTIVSRINQTSSKSVDFKKLSDFTEKKPTVGAGKDKGTADNLDISSLLAMGESGSTEKKTSKSRKRPAPRDSDSDWEEVEDWEHPQEEGIPAGGIVVELPGEFKRRTRKEIDLEACLKRKLNRQIKENQVYLHRVSILCFLATGNYLNGVLCKGKLLDAAIKLLPSQNSYPRKNGADTQYFQHMTSWFRGALKVNSPKMYGKLTTVKLSEQLDEEIRTRQVSCFRNFILIFLLLLRGMAIDSRLVLNFTGHPLRPLPSQLCRISAKPKVEKDEKIQVGGKKAKIEEKSPQAGSSKAPATNGKVSKVNLEKVSKSVNAKGKNVLPEKTLRDNGKVLRSHGAKIIKRIPSENTPDKQFEESQRKISPENEVSPRKTRSQMKAQTSQAPNLTKLKKASGKVQKKDQKKAATEEIPPTSPPVVKVETSPQPSTSRQVFQKRDGRLFAPEAVIPRKYKPNAIDRRVFSSDSDDWTRERKRKEDKMDIWVEVWSDKEKKWLTVDLFNGHVGKTDKTTQTASQPVAYVFAWHADKTVKDVSPRYCPQWNTTTRKFRIDPIWLEESLKPFMGRKTRRDKDEDRELDKLHLDKPLPKTISEFKDHPLYVLERHLLKFQALYPPNPPPLGYIRKEPIYARECVHTLQTRERWHKEARVVKPEQTAYKIVKTLKWDKYTSTILKDQPLEIFGIWQTTPYVPPVAKDGVVPRNEYGNVELFKDCMLPKNTVHLRLPGVNKICKRLNIDCAPAIVGFDFHSGWSHPTYDGFVICKEFEDTVLDAWNAEQDEAERKEVEKREKRVYGNWRKLIKGLLIKARLQAKYNFRQEAA
uniref:Putative nucleotide excision repair complex xpc-hr23b subunit xpc/dpb11 n=1 Tax=Lutzomyia longipalpis TaxID=7200 RepID=A0A1B0CUI9_LUTLO